MNKKPPSSFSIAANNRSQSQIPSLRGYHKKSSSPLTRPKSRHQFGETSSTRGYGPHVYAYSMRNNVFFGRKKKCDLSASCVGRRVHSPLDAPSRRLAQIATVVGTPSAVCWGVRMDLRVVFLFWSAEALKYKHCVESPKRSNTAWGVSKCLQSSGLWVLFLLLSCFSFLFNIS